MYLSSVEEHVLNVQVLYHEGAALIFFNPQISPVWGMHGVSVKKKRGFLQCFSLYRVERFSLLDESDGLRPAETSLLRLEILFYLPATFFFFSCFAYSSEWLLN